MESSWWKTPLLLLGTFSLFQGIITSNEPNPENNVTDANYNTTSVSLSISTMAADNTLIDLVNVTSTTEPNPENNVTDANYNTTSVSLSISTMAADNTLIDLVNVTSTTEPVRIPKENISVSSNGTVDRLFVSWIPPPGNVEVFFITLQDVKNTSVQKVNSTNSTSVIFTDLRPGRVYNITVITSSGPFNVTSANIQGITVPSPPGTIQVLNFSTNFISLNWGAPADMDDGSYSFNITYSGGSSTGSIVEQSSFITISNLNSATEYTISVTTLEPRRNLSSRIEEINHMTQPNVVNSLQVGEVGTNSITLNWKQPIGYKDDYRYLVVTKGSSVPTITIQNETVKFENVNVNNLIAGTNYTFTVITLVANVQSDSREVSSYTKPIRIPEENISVSSNGTVDRLFVSWIPPPGNVEVFFITLQDEKNTSVRKVNSTNSTSLTFADLRPGRVYIITVITSSGPFNVTSANVQGITVPSPPGTIQVLNFSTNFISLNWEAPADMDDGSYSFNITYSDGSSTRSIVEQSSFTTISNLSSATEYTISVATLGPRNLSSRIEEINHMTLPTAPGAITVTTFSTSSISLNWGAPSDLEDGSYSFNVTYDSGSAKMSETVNTTSTVILNITSGTNYTISVATVVRGNILSDVVSISQFTQPVQTPEANISVSSNGTMDRLFVSWIPPPGKVEVFFITLQDVKNTSVQKVNSTNSTSVIFTDLRPGRVYNVTVITSSGPFNVTSANVQGITVPSPPGTIQVLNFSTNFISLNWGAPADMDDGSYSFNITYSGGSSTRSIVEQSSFITISHLNSATEYKISVTTLGPRNLSSRIEEINHMTLPTAPGAITVTTFSTSSISLKWGAPSDLEDGSYSFNVTYDSGSAKMSETVNTTSTVILNVTSGTNYTISVATVVRGNISSDVVSISQFTQPNVVNSLQVDDVGTNSITLNWKQPIGYKDDYRYWVVTEDSSEPTITIQNETVQFENATVSNLIAGTNNTFTVITLVANVQSDSREVSSYTKSVQIPEENISVSSNGTVDRLFVSWIPPPGNVEVFFITLQDVKNTSVQKVNSTNSTSVIFTDLQPGRVYNITVITSSGPFNVTSANVQGITVPSPPGTIQVLNFSTNFISLNWGAPADMDDGSYSFNITYSDGSSTRSIVEQSSFITISNLSSATEYTISVATLGPRNLSSGIEEINHMTQPNVVNSLQVSEVGTNSITLNWKQPIGYKDDYRYLVVTKESSVPTITIQNETVQFENANVNNLIAGTNYTFTVITLVANVQSDSREVSSYTKPIQIPEENISVSSNGTVDRLFLSWIPPPGNVEVFFITLQDVKSTSVQKVNSTNSTSVIFTDLRPGRVYNITVITSSGPFNVTSANVQGITVPSPPGTIQVLNFSTNFISLNWGAPADMDDGSFSFNITYSDGSSTRSIVEQSSFITISNLNSATEYTISVTTLGPRNLSSGIEEINHMTQPNVVSNLQVDDVGTNSITLNWKQPIGYKDDYRYLVVTKKSSDPTIIIQNETVKFENASVSNLIAGINYTFTVITLVANVQSDSREVSSYTKPVRIPEENISVSSNGTVDRLFVSWTPPPGNVEVFFITLQDVKNTSVQKANSTNSTSVIFTDLRPGRVYNLTVITSSGPFSVTSANIQGITVPSPPGTIQVLNFSTNFISLNWGAPADMDDGSYSFNITYSDNSSAKTIVEQSNFTTISNLNSGTEYTISVATVGPRNLASRIEKINHTTQPKPIQNLRIVAFSTHSISLQWVAPVEDQKDYKYRVVTEAPEVNNTTKIVTDETVTVEGLTPGTNYIFSVVTLAKDDTPSESVMIANYTEPMKIPSENILLSNENTTDLLNVSWDNPVGHVENFSVQIKDSKNPEAYSCEKTVQPPKTQVEFSSLRPGRLYRVNVVTISGPHHVTSDDVTKATFPSPPRNIVVTAVTNSSLNFSWERPEDMVLGEYTFIVSYRMVQESSSTTYTEVENKSAIFNLYSGTNYIVTVLTNILQNLNSSFVTKSVYTKPNPVNRFHVSETSNSSISLTWDEPKGYQKVYKYRVHADGNTHSNKTVSNVNVLFDGLNSGDNFTFTIYTLAEDGTESDSIMLSQCTNAAAISSSSLKCKGVDRNSMLILNWTCPSGLNRGFHLQAKDSSSNVINETSTSCTSNQTQHFNLMNVIFFTKYVVSITTLSCGSQSTPVSTNCMSGVNNPPEPSTPLELPRLEFTHNTVKFDIKTDAFNASNGPVVAIAVIVTKDQSKVVPDDEDLEIPFHSGVSTYVTHVVNISSQNTRTTALEKSISVSIGDNSQSMGYVNKELTPLTNYRFSLAGFTKLKINEEKKIDSNKSIFTIYHYSQMVTLKQDPGVIIGAVAGSVLGAFVIIAPLLLFLWWKKRTMSKNENVTQLPAMNLSAISVDYFAGYFSKQHADSDCGFAEEYEELKAVGVLQSVQVAQQPLNKPKNRYSNVLPYDSSRVKLSVTSDPSSDYINANFMPGYNSQKEFIAAQGPLMNTVQDFWRMIWEHRVPAIVMLTKCVEQGRAKCEQYWPTERPLAIGDKIVTLTSEVTSEDWTIRDFSLVKVKTGEKYNIRQFHFLGWPDHGVPSTTGILVEFRNLVREYINQHQMRGPTVVHCSAGVGRTGTFISIDHMIHQIDNDREVNIWSIVYQLRMNRPLMVQTESQYVFLNQCAMEYIKSSKRHGDESVYENASILIYENTSAIRATNGHIP
ncbi:receptor-type tyrosine-protein phosphatase eta-like isoform X2 [Mobula hypostoma]|uniref:receptor-type tyrosine-protein phosphatase eta-like isoform X2 n=1 Tax=Mobula hypostoma TaxID=723540 RepID=UPI002FC2E08E